MTEFWTVLDIVGRVVLGIGHIMFWGWIFEREWDFCIPKEGDNAKESRAHSQIS